MSRGSAQSKERGKDQPRSREVPAFHRSTVHFEFRTTFPNQQRDPLRSGSEQNSPKPEFANRKARYEVSWHPLRE